MTGETYCGDLIPGTHQGDPEKRDYLHDPHWVEKHGKPFVGGTELQVDARACPGCIFPDAKPGKWPHLNDSRCKLRTA